MTTEFRARADAACAAYLTTSTPRDLAAARAALRDLDAVAGGPASAGHLLDLARHAAARRDVAAVALYREHVAARTAGPPPTVDDLALLADHDAWATVGAWASPSQVLDVLVRDGGRADPARAVGDLLRLHQDVASGRPARTGPDAPGRVAALATALADLLVAGRWDRVEQAAAAVDAIRAADGDRAALVAAATTVLAAVAAGAPEDAVGPALDDLALPLAPSAEHNRRARLLRLWLDLDPVDAVRRARRSTTAPAGSSARPPTRPPALPPASRDGRPLSALAGWAVLRERAQQPGWRDRPDPRTELRSALAAALGAAGGDTGLTRGLRLCLVTEELRRGALAEAGAELDQLRQAGASAEDAPWWAQVRALAAEVLQTLDTDWTGEPAPERPGGGGLATRWTTLVEHGRASPVDAHHPAVVADRAREVAALRTSDPRRFVDVAGAFCDELLAAGHALPRCVFSLRVAQADTLLRLGRITHARRVAQYAAGRLRHELPDATALITAADVARVRACLATGDRAAVPDGRHEPGCADVPAAIARSAAAPSSTPGGPA
jgi:hypothetical protein